MLDIVTAVDCVGRINSGGSTFPWVINVLNEDGDVLPYVVKLFTTRQLEQGCAVAKEVYGNVLAQQFELNVPEASLVLFEDIFLTTLSNEGRKELAKKDNRIKFGSLQMSGMPILNSTLGLLLKGYDVGTIFAFDYLIWNLDRGGFHDKPNILVNDDDFLLIDHEQIFPFANETESSDKSFIDKFLAGDLCYQYERHIFYGYLKGLYKPRKTYIFDTFLGYLNTLRVDILDSYAKQLEEYGQPVGNVPLIKSYLSSVKSHQDLFLRRLNQAIS